MVEFEYKKIVDQNGKTMFEGWTKNLILGNGAPIIDFGHNELGYTHLGDVKLICSFSYDNCNILPVFHHIDGTLEDNNKGVGLSAVTYGMLCKRIHNALCKGHEMYDYLIEHKGVLDLDFFINDSENIMHWKMSSSVGATAILTNWDDLAGEQEFYFSGVNVRTKLLGINDQGELIGLLAIENPVVPPGDFFTFTWTEIVLLQSSMIIQQPNIMDIKELSILDRMAWFDWNFPSTQGDFWLVQVPDN